VRYFLAAALAVVMAIPPANVGAGTDPTGVGVFVFAGANAKAEIENLACFDLGGSKSWLIAEITGEAGELVALTGDGAKVGKGPKFKDKGAIRRYDVEDIVVRPRGTTTTGSDVTGKMKASFNAKTDSATSFATDKTNGETLESPGGSPIQVYIATNQTGEVELCKATIAQLEKSKEVPDSFRSLVEAQGVRLR
jgi:hypothetical protein